MNFTVLPIIVLALVFVLIAVRQIGNIRLQIWQIMSGGAAAVLVTGTISPGQAIRAVNLDVILFLFGVFVVGYALEESGYLAYLSYHYFKRARTADQLVLMLLFGSALASAFLMNDTLAIIGTPVVLSLARKHRMPARLFLLALAFGITTGSVASPIGNPQNLLIAVNAGMSDPFATFATWLALPTVVNLVAAYVMLKLFFKAHWTPGALDHSERRIQNPSLALLAKIGSSILIGMAAAKIVLAVFAPTLQFSLTAIALISALPILIFSADRKAVLKGIDWRTLIFFAAMFVLMQSVWNSGVFQSLLTEWNIHLNSPAVIMGVSIFISQWISNVPLVALLQPLLMQAGAHDRELMALAAGSTIAGNLFILGAASNVIIIQNAERKSGETITFLQFAAIGLPLTILNAVVYWAFFTIR